MFSFLSSSKAPNIQTAKCNGTYFGVELFDMCLCGATVQPNERQQLHYYEEKKCWLRLCAKCIELSKKSPKNVPIKLNDDPQRDTSVPVTVSNLITLPAILPVTPVTPETAPA